MGIFQKWNLNVGFMNKKIRRPHKEQGEFLLRLGEMLGNGFAMADAIEFYNRLERKNPFDTISILEELRRGNPLHEALFKENFDTNACVQIFFADKHGFMPEALKGAGQYLLKKNQDRKTMFKLLQYPIVLVIILLAVMILLRNILLPQFENLYVSMGYNPAHQIHYLLDFIKYTPIYLISIISGAAILLILLHFYFRGKSSIQKAQIYSKIPFINFYYKLYLSQFLAREWSFLLKSGFSLNEVLQHMMKQSFRPLLRDTAAAVNAELKLGQPFSTVLSSFSFLESEFIMIVRHGEKNGKLAQELLYYSQFSLARMEEKIQKVFRNLQPAIFVVIGILIIAVYISILYPMFQMIDAV